MSRPFRTLLKIVRGIANAAIVVTSALFQAPEDGIIPSGVVSFASQHGWLVILASTFGIWVLTWWLRRSPRPQGE